jgi:phosphoglycolate phosphatase-like HAD superfamily hydrolase
VTTLHIVWDWNGTLLDDLDVVVDALNIGIGNYGLAPIGHDDYRDHYTRPVRALYDAVFARPVADHEWADLNETFHAVYSEMVPKARLADDSLAALTRIDQLQWSQSVLSMSPHDLLLSMVTERGLGDRFTSIDGLQAVTGGLKAGHLEEHLEDGGHTASETVVIGDTPDDADAARSVGANVVLYDGGSHHRHTLESVGVPVAHTLVEAVEIVDRTYRP